MLNLFVTEYLRYQKLAIMFCLGHFIVLMFLMSLGLVLMSRPYYNLWVLFISIGGVALGLVQMFGHKRMNYWMYLLQRPLEDKKIVLALLLAGMCHLIITAVLPYLLTLIIIDMKGIYGVELRFYYLVPWAAAAVITTYLMGCVIALNPHRLGFLIMILIIVYVANFADAQNGVMAAFLLVVMFVIAVLSFKPDLSKVTNKIGTLLLIELPIRYCVFLLVVMLVTVSYQIMWITGEGGPYTNPEPNTAYALLIEEPEQVMLASLEESSYPRRDFIRQQIEIGEIVEVRNSNFFGNPRHNQRPSFDNALTVNDPENSDRKWQFSHSRMLYKGWDLETEQFIGWLGPKGFNGPEEIPELLFESIPWVAGNEFVINDKTIYQIDWVENTLVSRFELGVESSERFSDSFNITENVTSLLSNENLYIFRSAEVMDSDSELQVRTILPLPNPANEINSSMLVMELIEGYLVSILKDIPPDNLATDFTLYGEAEILLYKTDESFTNELINRRPLEQVYSDVDLYYSFVLSPAMRVLTDFQKGLYFNKGKENIWSIFNVKVPLYILLAATLVCIFSSALTYRILRDVKMPDRTKAFWIVINGLTGLIGLISFGLGLYWKKLSLIKNGNTAKKFTSVAGN